MEPPRSPPAPGNDELREIMHRSIEHDLAAGEARITATRARYADPERFLVTSHGDWARLVDRTGLAHAIPTHPAGRFAVDDLLDGYDQDEAAAWRIRSAEHDLCRAAEQLELRAGQPFVWRTDACAPGGVKAACDRGRDHREIAGPGSRHEPILFDLRVVELAGSWPRPEVELHLRPYIEPTIVDGWPLEYRVWVLDGAARAVANYYPQRPLPERNPAVLFTMGTAAGTAEQIAAACAPFDLIPHNPDAGAGITFTADFLVDAGRRVRWLECGPYTFPNWGAHPCTVDDLAVFAGPGSVHLAFGSAEEAARLRQRRDGDEAPLRPADGTEQPPR